MNNTCQPYFDITEIDNTLWITVDLPSVPTKNIFLEIIGDTLRLKGKMELTRQKDEQTICMEFAEELYSLELQLASYIDKENITAYTHHGSLCIHLNYLDTIKRKEIPIKFNNNFF